MYKKTRKHLHYSFLDNTIYCVVHLHITKNTQNLDFTSKKFRSTIIKDLKEIISY